MSCEHVGWSGESPVVMIVFESPRNQCQYMDPLFRVLSVKLTVKAVTLAVVARFCAASTALLSPPCPGCLSQALTATTASTVGCRLQAICDTIQVLTYVHC